MSRFFDRNFLLEVSKGNIPGHSFMHKFGRNPDLDIVDGMADIWDYAPTEPTYNYSTIADIDSISSSDGGDLQTVEIQGLDTNWALVTQTATLNGQTRVALGTSLIRVFRMANTDTTDFAGQIYCYVNTAITAGVPNDTTKVRAYVDGGNNQTLMAIYTVPAGQTGYLLQGFSSIARKKAAMFLGEFLMRPFGGVFQLKETFSLHSTGSGSMIYPFPVPLPIPAKTDVTTRADTDTNNVGISAAFDILLVDN